MGRITFILGLILVCYGALGQSNKILLTFNQTTFAPGDTAFFKSYYLNEHNKSEEGVNLISLHLVDENGSSVHSMRFRVFGGVSYNQVFLPESLKPGLYNVITYDYNNPASQTLHRLKIVKDSDFITEPGKGKKIEKAYVQPDIYLLRDTLESRQETIMQIDMNGKEALLSVSVVKKFDPSIIQPQLITQKTLVQSTQLGKIGANSPNKITLRGVAVDKNSGKPVEPGTQLLFYFENSMARYLSLSLFEGMFELDVLDVSGQDEIYCVGNYNGKIYRNIALEWANDSLSFQSAPQVNKIDIKSAYAEFMGKKNMIDRSFSGLTSSQITGDSSHIQRIKNIEKIIGEPNVIYDPDDYYLLPNMAENIKEIFRALFYSEHNDNRIVRVRFLEPEVATDDPMYVIDGWVTMDSDLFLSLDPTSLKSIKIVKDRNKLLRFGFMGKNGIVLVETKSGNFQLPEESTFTITGVSKPIKPASLDFSEKRPEFRSTLYWNPSVELNRNQRSTITFYTSDDRGAYEIFVEGITMDGQTVFGKKSIYIE